MAISKLPSYQLALSAGSVEEMRQKINKLHHFLLNNPFVSIEDIIFSVNLLHKKQEYRATFYAKNHFELLAALQDYHIEHVPPLKLQEPKIAFIFTGQGVQHPGMMKQLYQTEATFKSTIDHCSEILQPWLSASLPQLLFNLSAKELCEARYAHPALFSVELALALTLRHYGVHPHAIIGHSSGEYVAAVLADSIVLSDALRIIHLRSELLQHLSVSGGMLALKQSEKVTKKLLLAYCKLYPDAIIDIALVNSASQTVIAGSLAELRRFSRWLHKKNVANIFLSVSHAFHSSLMEPILDEFEKLVVHIKHYDPQILMINNLTGKPFSTQQLNGHYWCRQLRETVRFYDGLKWLSAHNIDIFLEVGPHPALISTARSSFHSHKAHWLATLRHDHKEWENLLTSLTELYLAGVDVNWPVFARANGNTRHLIPFQLASY